MTKITKSIHPDDEEHYKKLGLKKDTIELWEDGRRVEGKKGEYEWWYNDFNFPDGTKLVIIYYLKFLVDSNGPIKPQVTFELTMPDGTKYEETVFASIKDSHFEKNICDVKIGECSIKGDLKHYNIIFKGKNMQANITLDGTIPSWRSQTGSIFYGEKEEAYFGWLPAIPSGKAIADITYNGNSLHLEGIGYHDHNWGNYPIQNLMHHWYWGRAIIGNYNLISVWMTSEKKYGYKEHDVFMLAKDGQIIADNSNHTLKFMPEDEYIDQISGKPVYNKVIYEYTTDTNETYKITYIREQDIDRKNFIEYLHGITKFGAKLIGFDGGYIRFSGTATIEKIVNNQIIETVTDKAIWELMYFGKSGADKKM